MKWTARAGHLWLVGALLLAACVGEGDLRDALPGANEIPGWAPAGEAQVFNTENLYDLVNGQADSFFAYGFQQVAVQTYEAGTGASLRVEIWQLAAPGDAYGLFTAYRAGDPVSVGNDGDAEPGRRLDFWQDRYYVRVFAARPVDDAALHIFAKTVAGALPAGGERPSLLGRLPPEDLVEGSDIYFHQEISIQDQLWLGGQNLLGLGPGTDAVLGRYELAGERIWLLLVEYPDVGAASAALQSLQAGEIDGLVVALVQDSFLGAVFGSVSQPEAQPLLLDALEYHQEGLWRTDTRTS